MIKLTIGVENRCRFALEVIGAIVDEIGGDRVGINEECPEKKRLEPKSSDDLFG